MIQRKALTVVIPFFIAGMLLLGAARLLTYTLMEVNPPANSHDAPAGSAVSITYPQDIDAATVNSTTFAVRAMQSGRVGAYSTNGGQIIFEPASPFLPGELVQASATTGTTFLSGGAPLTPTVWQFRIGPEGGSGIFDDSGQAYPVGATFDAALGDLDGDGDLDAVSTHSGDGTLVWINSGGAFSSSPAIDTGVSHSAALGDLDGDGDLDAFFGNSSGDQVWLNQGGILSKTTQLLGNTLSRDVALGDLDGDGDLDAVTANYVFVIRENFVWLNDGRGSFSASGQSLPGLGEAVSLGDVDGDGDLDAVFGQDARSSGSSTQIWLNDGHGMFSMGDGFGAATRTRGNALGDLNNDGHLDIVTANFQGADMTNRAWLNDGSGTFNDSGQALGSLFSHQVALGDLNGDSDLDILVANSGPYELWTNDGQAGFARAEYSPVGNTADLGDLDGDGDLDTLFGDINPGRFRIWFNSGSPQGSDLEIDVSDVAWLASPSNSAVQFITVTNKGPEAAEDVFLYLSHGRITDVGWYPNPFDCLGYVGGGVCNIGQMAIGQEVVLLAEITYQTGFGGLNNQAVEFEILAEVHGSGVDPSPSNNVALVAIVMYDCLISTARDCVTTTIWCRLITGGRFLKQVVESLPFHLPDIYAVRDNILSRTLKGSHYIDLYYTHDTEIGELVLDNSVLLDQAIDTLAAWQPNLEALVEGRGESAIITAGQAAAVDDFLSALSAAASPALQQVIEDERAKLPPPAEFVGLSMEEARALVVGYGIDLPLIIR